MPATRYRKDMSKKRVVKLTGHARVTGSTRALRGLARGGGSGGGDSGAGGGSGGGSDLARRLREAAKIIGDQAKINAAWSKRIPPSIKITGGGVTISISSGAPPAYPNEIAGVRHPVFGGRDTRRPHAPWVTNQHRPFLAPAADEKADEAAAEFAEVIDDWAKEKGFK